MKYLFILLILAPTFIFAQVGIGTTTPSQELDVAGNVAFSGALMPNNNAGALNNFLKSNSGSLAPNWVQMDTTYISDFSVKVRSLLSGGDGIDYNTNTGVITNTASSKTYFQDELEQPGTNNSSDVTMVGFGSTITPDSGNEVLVIISGDISQSGNDGNSTLQIYYGTGTPPDNGDDVVGTAAGSEIHIEFKGTGSQIKYPFSTNVIITGLTPGTTYWMDLGTTNSGGNSIHVEHVSISAVEL